ncbi:MAG: alpha/beta hydrolase [Gemmatimonadetes bacterium]|nr:alpha/beta hydrolase [Gemmatimonadota bacterium]
MTDPIPPRWRPYPTVGSNPGIDLVVRRVLSPQFHNFRNVMVALPPSYRGDQERRYPVVYMQDGQNLFDPTTSYAGAWNLTAILARLAGDGIEALVVAIANAGKRRIYEYAPFADRRHGGGGGDRYVAFVIDTLKPIIDRDFRTLRDRAHTAIAGSSMGGLISLYAAFHRADVFGAVGALSPSLWFGERAFLRYLRSHPRIVSPRVHLDIGLHEPSHAVADVRALRETLEKVGHTGGSGLQYLEDETGAHDEETWGRRFSRAMPFLVSGAPSGSSDGQTG